jgi:hypothetical protein
MLKNRSTKLCGAQLRLGLWRPVQFRRRWLKAAATSYVVIRADVADRHPSGNSGREAEALKD